MIHYHGGPVTPMDAAVRFYQGRHAMVSFAAMQDLPIVAEVCQTFALDNGAFTFWTQNKAPNWTNYFQWVDKWMTHPGFDWALIPDVIGGDEDANDTLIETWPFPPAASVPVWHLHEDLNRLDRLAHEWPRIAFGSSGQFATVGDSRWWGRMNEALMVVCDDQGRPRTKLHGLRMLDPDVFQHIPLSSADSTNAARNCAMDTRWNGVYAPPNKATRALVLAERVEVFQSAPAWIGQPQQESML